MIKERVRNNKSILFTSVPVNIYLLHLYSLHLQYFPGGIFALYSLLCRNAKVGLLPCDRTTDEVVLFEETTTPSSKINTDSKARRAIEKHKSCHYLILFLALFGSCMTIGAAVLTPALSGGIHNSHLYFHFLTTNFIPKIY